jgi:tetratricopeptide (TPR) repeat protein
MKKETFALIILFLTGNLAFSQKDELFELGEEKMAQRDYPEAIEYFSKALLLDPKFEEARYLRAEASYFNGDYILASVDCELVIEQNPKHVKAYFIRGASYVSRSPNYYSKAIQDYSTVIELDPNLVDAYFNRGALKDILGDYRGALLDINKYIEMTSQKQSADYIYRGQVKIKINDFSGAIQDLNLAITMDSKASEAYYYLGLAKIKTGQRDTGCLQLSKAGELGYRDAYDAIREHCN